MTQPGQNNLLLALHGFAQQQNENFTSQAFVHLLRHLLTHESKAAVSVLKSLTGAWLRLDEDASEEVRIATQVRSPDGQPDIEILLPGQFVIVEVKVDADISRGQLTSYRKILQESGCARTRLVLLTRFATDFKLGEEEPDYAVRWYEVADWLERAAHAAKKETSTFLCRQFLGFLGGRGLTMEQVGWELVPGIRALSNFREMLEEALRELGGKVTRGTGSDFAGCCYRIESRHLWTGIEFSEPSVMKLIAYKGTIGSALVLQKHLDLSSDSVHFFVLSNDRQIECIERFIRKAVEEAKRRRR